MKVLHPLLLLLALFVSSGRGDEIDEAFLTWKETMEASAKRLGEASELIFDRDKGILRVTKTIPINEMRNSITIQVVPVAVLDPEIELEGLKNLPEPWLKLRCIKNQKKVMTQRRTIIDGVEVEEISKDLNAAFVVMTCHRTDLNRAKAQAEQFLKLVQSVRNP